MADRGSPLGRALTHRIFFLALAMALVAIGLITFFNFQTLRQETSLETNLFLSQSSMIVDEFFNHQFSHLETLSLAGVIGKMEPEARRILLERLLQENPEFNEISLLSSAGTEIVKASRYEYISPLSRVSHAEHEHFKEALAGKRSQGHVNFKTGRSTIQIAVPVKRSPADIAGVLEAEIDLRFLSEWIARVRLGRTGTAYLVDSNGLIIAHSEPAFALDQIIATQIPSVAAALEGREIRPYGPGSRYENLAGKRVVAGGWPLPALGWGLIVEREEVEILSRILPMALLMTAGALIVLIFYYLAAITLLRRRVIEPITALTGAVREFEEVKELITLDFKSKDEISELAGAFYKMSQSLSTRVKELRQSQSLLSTILENITQGVYLLDSKGKVEYANGVVSREFNVSPKALLGLDVRVFMEHRYQKKFDEEWEKMKDQLTPFSFEMEYLTGRGKVEPGMIFLSPIISPEGGFAGAVLLGVNLTLVKEEEKKRLREERLAALGLMASKISHELRNPLTTMSNSIYYLQQNLKDSSEKIRSHLEMLGKQVQGSTHLIASILDFTRPREPVFYPLDLNQVLQQALERVPLTEDIKPEVNLAPDLPPISGDAQLLMQVFINLLTNACQAMPEGGKLELSTRIAGGMVAGIVKDTGVGIEPEFLKNLFQPFHSSKARGLGLGLSISRDIVEKHGGHIEVQSQEGQGSAFSIFLPLTKDIKQY